MVIVQYSHTEDVDDDGLDDDVLTKPLSRVNFEHSLEEISTQNGPFNFYSNSISSCVSQ